MGKGYYEWDFDGFRSGRIGLTMIHIDFANQTWGICETPVLKQLNCGSLASDKSWQSSTPRMRFGRI